MSVFQIKEWWSASVGNSEEFDQNSICISNIDNEQPAYSKIILGNSPINSFKALSKA